MTATIDQAMPAARHARATLARPSQFIDFPSTEALLTEGGDARILIGPGRSTNCYDRAPRPDPELAAYGSSTASTISEPAYAVAERLRDRLALAATREAPSRTYARELNRIRAGFLDLCNLSDLPDLAMLFAASGTDIHLLAAQLIAGSGTCPLLAVMTEASETGSRVAAALAGTHFSSRTAMGDVMSEGGAVDGRSMVTIASVAAREADGTPRAVATVDREVESLVAEAAAAGRRVLLTLVDVSKTGLISPSPAAVLALCRQFPQTVDVLVDACQFRLAPATLRAYLECGFMVAVTGSKFLAGPAFSGGLLVPSRLAARLRRQCLPQGLAAYSARADWPDGWAAAQGLRDGANYGLLLRWEAALTELRGFRAIPEVDVTALLGAFGRSVQARLAADPAFDPLPVPTLDRRAIRSAPSWDTLPTIFPFRLRHPKADVSGRPFTNVETERVYRQLGTDVRALIGPGSDDRHQEIAARRVEIGQPVSCGTCEGTPVSALRLCASARLVATAAGADSRRARAAIEDALTALDKVALVAQTISAP